MTKTEEMVKLMKETREYNGIHERTCPVDNEYQGARVRMLFVCSAGLLRSPTAAAVAENLGYNTRSCGSSLSYAIIPITVNLVHWAKVIFFVNEENYEESLEVFEYDTETIEMLKKKAVIWDIEDDYEYYHPTLVSKVKHLMEKYTR